MVNPDILSLRYATDEINYIFSEYGKNLFERELWIAVLKGEKDLGVDIPDDAIAAYENAKENIDLERIKEIERVTKHDIKAKIQAFNEAAGGKYQLIHRPMTSRDLSDNVEQMQIKRTAEIIFGKYVSVLRHLVEKAEHYADLVMSGRTHHQVAQLTTLGRRFSMWAEELYGHLVDFENFIQTYPLRGLKGAIGTQSDLLSLLCSEEKVEKLEEMIAKHLGFENILISPGQVYPRSLDYKLASNLSSLSASCENLSKTMRLMSGLGLVTEGFKPGQVGSSAMPHKMNTRSSERVSGFAKLLKMFAMGVSLISGDQWEEGDVSCSVVRRVIIPGMSYASDGLVETMLTVLNEMGAYDKTIEAENDRHMPFLATTELLNAATKRGMGREDAHDIIKKYAVGEALRMRQEGSYDNNLAELLGNDSDFPLNKEEIKNILEEKMRLTGNAARQIYKVVEKANELIGRYSKEAEYEPREIL